MGDAVTYYRKLPCGIKHLDTGRGMYLLGTFCGQKGKDLMENADDTVDTYATLVSLETLPDAPETFKMWFIEERKKFESKTWKSMCEEIRLGKTAFTPGMYRNKQKAIDGK